MVSKSVILGLSLGLGIGGCCVVCAIVFLLFFCGFCDSIGRSENESEEETQIGGIPLGSKPPKLTDEQKAIRETAIRRYKRRLRREALASRREARRQQMERLAVSGALHPDEVGGTNASEPFSKELMEEDEESVVSSDTALTASTVASTVVYGRGAYNVHGALSRRESSLYGGESTNMSTAHSRSSSYKGSSAGGGAWNSGGASAFRRKSQQRRRRQRLHAEFDATSHINTWEVAFDPSEEGSDVDERELVDTPQQFQPENLTPGDISLPRYTAQDHPTPPRRDHVTPRWTEGDARENIAISGFFANS